MLARPEIGAMLARLPLLSSWEMLPPMSIKSVVKAGDLLRVLAEGQADSLKQLARRAGMTAPQAHKYLASLMETGLARQDRATGTYELGPLALQLGLAAMARLSFVDEAAQAAQAVCRETGLPGHISVWGPQGPVIVRLFRGAAPFVTTLGLGVVAPLLTSATGMVFLAFSPPRLIEPQLRAECAQRSDGFGKEQVDALVARVRSDRLAWVSGSVVPGLAAVSAPVLDWQNEAACSITLVSADARLVQPESKAAKGLDAAARSLSAEFGAAF